MKVTKRLVAFTWSHFDQPPSPLVYTSISSATGSPGKFRPDLLVDDLPRGGELTDAYEPVQVFTLILRPPWAQFEVLENTAKMG